MQGLVIVAGMVMTVVCAQQPYTYIEFQMQVARKFVGITVAESCCYEKFALIAIGFPLQVVFAASGIQTDEMSCQYVLSLPLSV